MRHFFFFLNLLLLKVFIIFRMHFLVLDLRPNFTFRKVKNTRALADRLIRSPVKHVFVFCFRLREFFFFFNIVTLFFIAQI